ncbi:CdaR family transcriptional regulator [Ursidibacter arcticus]
MKLSKSIANLIVKRTMQIIPYSVNVMDENGIIIASGDSARLNQKHTGAILSLRKNQITEIDSDLVKLWNDEVKEGINLPLNYFGNTVGVVGISGNPKEIRQYAQLVKMAAELIMEQSFEIEKDIWKKRYKEEFIKGLLTATLTSEQIKQQADFWKINIHQPISVVLLKIKNVTPELLQKLLSYFEYHYPTLFIAVIEIDKLALLKEEIQDKNLFRDISQIFSTLNIQGHIVVGAKVKELCLAYISYQTAYSTLIHIERIAPKKKLVMFDEYKIPSLFQEFSDSWQAKELLKPFKKLLEQDENHLLVKSLQCYFLSNCDLVHASQKLFIHPNTLRYRLDKIERITSLSFNKIDEKFVLYLGSIWY